ncbi:unnamed protein product [Prorocentrum cordatum]|uniref:Uncharacterized protein n=1 Tax=Prorocentrum cordatum TaxID=2364126 RepID=A0ABN9WBE3_9DINO|nr:unnamed protein product [Polarella glacialis]
MTRRRPRAAAPSDPVVFVIHQQHQQQWGVEVHLAPGPQPSALAAREDARAREEAPTSAGRWPPAPTPRGLPPCLGACSHAPAYLPSLLDYT